MRQNMVVAIDDEGGRVEAVGQVACDGGQRQDIDRRDDPAANLALPYKRCGHVCIEAAVFEDEVAPLQPALRRELLDPMADFGRFHRLFWKHLDVRGAAARRHLPHDASIIQVTVEDEHPSRIRNRGKRPRQGARHGAGIIDLEAAGLIQRGNARHGISRTVHVGAERTFHALDQQRRAAADEVEGVAVVGTDRQREHAANRNQNQSAETQCKDGGDRESTTPVP